MMNTTTSIRTKLAMVLMIVPRMTDPRNHEQITEEFRFATEKTLVQDTMKARAKILAGSVFRVTDAKTSSGQGGGLLARGTSCRGRGGGKGGGGRGEAVGLREQTTKAASTHVPFADDSPQS